jgi:hypothetical protein
MYLVSSAFTARPTTLLALIRLYFCVGLQLAMHCLNYIRLKFVSEVHGSAYWAIISYFEIPGNCCHFRAIAFGDFKCIMFITGVNVDPPFMPHVLSLLCVVINCIRIMIEDTNIVYRYTLQRIRWSEILVNCYWIKRRFTREVCISYTKLDIKER